MDLEYSGWAGEGEGSSLLHLTHSISLAYGGQTNQ